MDTLALARSDRWRCPFCANTEIVYRNIARRKVGNGKPPKYLIDLKQLNVINYMILGLDDIPGGTAFVSFLFWMVLTGLYYLVCYQAALNVLDDVTRNSWLKIPAMLCAAIPTAGLMVVFHYKPYVFAVLVSITNYFRVQKKILIPNPKWGDMKVNPTLFYLASYGYIASFTALAFYFPTLDFSE